jgi:hypothetical protein
MFPPGCVAHGGMTCEERGLVPHPRSSLMFLTLVLEILSYIIHTILRYKILVFTFEGQAKNTIIDIE